MWLYVAGGMISLDERHVDLRMQTITRGLALLGLAAMILVPMGSTLAGPWDAPQAQGGAFSTPTPGPDGRIIYIVQENDDFWTIAAIADISLDELYALNGIQPGDFAVPGMELLLGFSGPAQASAQPESQVTPTFAEPTPTPEFSTANLCVLLYLDENGNASLDTGEEALAGGQVSIVDASGALVEEIQTTEDPAGTEDPEGTCIENLDAGDYNISAAVPEEYNPTTSMSLPLRMQAGDVHYVQFGAQPSAAISNQGGQEGGGASIWFGVIGGLLLLAAGGLGYYAFRYDRRSPPSLQ